MNELARYNRLVLWGGVGDLDSLRHIWRAYRQTALKLGLDAVCVPDVPESRGALQPGVLCIAADVWSKHLGAAVPGVSYATHNLTAGSALIDSVAPENHISVQVYTDDALQYEHDVWDACRLWHGPGRTLFAPWGTDLLAEEFYDPVFNAGSDECAFVGAIWDDGGLGNAALMPRLKTCLERRRLRFTHLTQISDAAMLDAVRRSRIAPALAGAWQCEKGYIPCRALKHPSYGVLAVTNVPRVRDLYAGCHVAGDTVEELIDNALHLSSRDYIAMTKAQQGVAARYTYREGLASIARAFEAVR